LWSPRSLCCAALSRRFLDILKKVRRRQKTIVVTAIISALLRRSPEILKTARKKTGCIYGHRDHICYYCVAAEVS